MKPVLLMCQPTLYLYKSISCPILMRCVCVCWRQDPEYSLIDVHLNILMARLPYVTSRVQRSVCFWVLFLFWREQTIPLHICSLLWKGLKRHFQRNPHAGYSISVLTIFNKKTLVGTDIVGGMWEVAAILRGSNVDQKWTADKNKDLANLAIQFISCETHWSRADSLV